MDPGTDNDTTGVEHLQCGRDQRANGGEDDGGVERLWWTGQRIASPFATELERKALGLYISGRGEREHAPSLVSGNLGDDVGGRPEPVQAEPPRFPRHPERPVADQPRAEQGRCLLVVVALR